MIDFEEIRKEIAIEHNTLLRKDDPILMGATLNDLMFRHYSEHLAQQVAEQNEAHRKAIDAALQKGIADAKVTAGRVITQASDYASEQMHTAVSSAMDEALAEIKKELSVTRKEVESAKKGAFIAAGIAGVCAVLSFGALVAVV